MSLYTRREEHFMGKLSVTHNGIVYTKYEGRHYYNPNGTYIKNGYAALHRQVWIDANGDIPQGHHIHHIDHDQDNNDISNLQCIEAGTHQRLHGHLQKDEVQAKLKEWRESDEGKATLRENAVKMRERTPERKLACKHCKKSFVTKSSTAIYCGQDCADHTHIGKIKKSCPVCKKTFWTKKHSYKEVKTCSGSCGWVLRRGS